MHENRPRRPRPAPPLHIRHLLQVTCGAWHVAPVPYPQAYSGQEVGPLCGGRTQCGRVLLRRRVGKDPSALLEGRCGDER